ncbi:MAG: amino acid adenylation domain-containing protein [Verrucomicrobiae bacterium]|nr:amino acid adenylation domain-containing protein [Verrucomicrobiae bacterium]
MGSKAPEPNITFPLTPMQEGMLFHCLAAPHSGVDVEQVIGTIREPLDLPAFNRAWQRLVDRHEALRMRFLFDERGSARQFPRDGVVLAVDHTDCSDLQPDEQELRLQGYLKADRQRGFDPRADLPSRVAVFRFGESRYSFVWTWWHGILDGRARLILLRELFLFYEAELHGDDCDLPLPRPYTEYTQWLAGRESTAALPYWKALLEDFSEPTAVGGTRPAVTDPSADRFNKHEVRLSEADTTRLRAFVGEHGVTMNTLIQAAWALVLGAFSGQDDVVFGNTRACRRSAFDGDGSGDGVVGALINTVPVRVRIGPELRVVEWLRQLREQHLAVRPFELTPLVQIQACSGVRSDRRLFDSLVVYENQLLDSALRTSNGEWATRRFEIRGCPGFALLVYGYGEPSLLLGIANERQHVDDATAARMLAHLVQAMLSLAEYPQALVTAIPLLPPAERQMLLEDWNRTEAPFEVDGTIDSCFARQAARTPNAPALTFNGQCWSFRELDEAAEGIAKRLRAAGAKPELVVGVCIGRSRELVASLLGILKSGAAYLPLDPTYPNERLATMIQDSEPLLVLATESTAEILAGTGARIMLVDGDVEDPMELSAPADWQPASSRNLAYLIYTSGSTGKPKGVMVEHRNVMNFFAGLDRVFGVEPGVVLGVTSVSFDPSVHEILWSLTRGYNLVIWPGVQSIGEATIPSLIREHHVTIMLGVPSLYRMILDIPGGLEALSSLRHLVVGGEPLSRELLQSLGDTVARRMVNMYGPTEATVAATAWQVATEDGQISIGTPLANTRIYVLNRHLQPVPLGVIGELFIGGGGVARGYLKRPELTRERFIRSPFNKTPDERLYRTGDLVRWRLDGKLDYLGRADGQVKIRGHRIELGEVEARLAKHPSVRACVVDIQAAERGNKRLVAYLVPSERQMTTTELRDWMGRELPDYMVPAVFVQMESLPLSPNGKVDRGALPQLDQDRSQLSGDYVAPRTRVEQQVANIWAKALGVERVGIHDGFFDLGGHSLLAMQVIAEKQKAFGVEVSLNMLFEAPTVAQFAAALEKTHPEGNRARPSAIQRIARQARKSVHSMVL